MHTTIRFGSRGADAQYLQNQLNKLLTPHPNLRVDGDFGRRTYEAVQRFQTVKNLGVDGVVGPKTWKALEGGIVPAPPISSIPSGNSSNAPWMAVAANEKGQEEIRGSLHNPRIVEYHASTSLQATSDETPWCSAFVNWCLKQAGIAGTNSAAAASWVSWGRATSSQYGAIIVIYKAGAANSSLTSSGNHVGFLIEETTTHYSILGGNQRNRVKISSYPKSSFQRKVMRWPLAG
ncbi:TIGR02594 family protein [Methylobacter sp. Wu1]|uniref:NlpC/P60 family protein n=1 Tax=Methylobacter sp. Wu1 TaxID=3119359 RepID=UPI002F93562A